jgi:DHA1 family bicyclomycin/chloramphenicol resistance-like MFS transporter
VPTTAATGQHRRNVLVLGLLSTFGPISLDLYLAALPQLAAELRTSAAAAQLSITTCLLGLAVGQVLAGPLSDRFGRRRPLIAGLVVYLLASAACALAPSIAVLLLLRLVQGLAGAAGLVIARAVVRDLYSGRALVVFFARLMLISGFAPVVAPVLGGQLTRVMSWRGIFLVLAVFALVLLLAGLSLPESLPPARRTTGGIAVTLRGFRILLGDRLFVGAALSTGLVGASLFAYIAGSTFVLQEIYGLSPQAFSLVFGANSVAILAMGQLAAGLTRWWSAGRILALGLLVNLLGAAALTVSVLAGLGLWFVVASLLVMVGAVGLVFAPATALAMADYPDQAGAASSLLGLGQYIAGALVAPLVGLGGSQSATPLAVVALSSSVGAAVVFTVFVRPALRGAPGRVS